MKPLASPTPCEIVKNFIKITYRYNFKKTSVISRHSISNNIDNVLDWLKQYSNVDKDKLNCYDNLTKSKCITLNSYLKNKNIDGEITYAIKSFGWRGHFILNTKNNKINIGEHFNEAIKFINRMRDNVNEL